MVVVEEEDWLHMLSRYSTQHKEDMFPLYTYLHNTHTCICMCMRCASISTCIIYSGCTFSSTTVTSVYECLHIHHIYIYVCILVFFLLVGTWSKQFTRVSNREREPLTIWLLKGT